MADGEGNAATGRPAASAGAELTIEREPEGTVSADGPPVSGAGANGGGGSIAANGGAIGVNVLAYRKIQNIKVQVQAVLGGISLTVEQLTNLKKGEIVALDTKIGDAIDIVANGQRIAKGEIIVVEGDEPRFGIVLTEITDTDIDSL